MKRVIKVLVVAAFMVVLMATMVSPAFAIGYHCGKEKDSRKPCPEYNPPTSGTIWGWGADENNENFPHKPVYG